MNDCLEDERRKMARIIIALNREGPPKPPPHSKEREFLSFLAVPFLFGILLPAFLKAAGGSASPLLSHDAALTFEQISVEDGLSQSAVKCIYQDRQGYMWFGTEDGLNRYDGYDFKVFRHDPEDSTSISSDEIQAICEDRFGTLWIGTNLGLNKHEPTGDAFQRYSSQPNDTSSLSHDDVRFITSDRTGVLWIGTNGGGLHRLDPETGTIKRYRTNPANPFSLSSDFIYAIHEDQHGELWIGTASGLDRLDRQNERFVHYRSDPNDPGSLSSNTILSICEDTHDRLWIGTVAGLHRYIHDSDQFVRYHHDPNDDKSLSHNLIRSMCQSSAGGIWIATYRGLNQFDVEEGRFYRYLNDPLDPQSLSRNILLSAYEDRGGVLWVGTYGAGINKASRWKKKFVHFHSDPNNLHSLNDNMVHAFHEDQHGFLWIGTHGGGLNRFDRATGLFSHYKHDPRVANSLSHDAVVSILQDDDGFFWIGTEGGGLNRLNPVTEDFEHFQFDSNDPHSLSNNFVWSLCQDRRGELWVGTYGGGLNRLGQHAVQTERQSFIRYQHNPDDPNSISSNLVYRVVEDREGFIWVGTESGGLNRLDRERMTFTHFQYDPSDTVSLSNNTVVSIHETSNGSLWIGTLGGLNKFDRVTSNFKRLDTDDGLPNNVVYEILEDNQGFLWLSTNQGLSRFDPATETFRNYDMSDGLQSNEFNLGASYKGRSGEMFFGGVNGFNVFDPERLRDNPNVPQIAITDFAIFNKSVRAGKNSPLQKHISETKEIKLTYKENVFSFAFAALDYTNPKKNQYRYMMEGFDEDWVDTGTRRFATYTNLNPGDYVFKVMGSNNDGIWSRQAAALRITIMPPYWQTWWFRLAATATILLSAYNWYRRRINRMEARRKELEQRAEEKTRAADALQHALDEVEHLKNRLYAENVYLRGEIQLVHNFETIITRSDSLKRILRNVEQVASTDATVLILGESGTGKELIARAIHNISPRGERPLVKVNCSSLPSNLIESELFGHEKGAFTGATSREIGRFELAHEGTIFLDEIGDLPLELQVKLLRVLQEGEFERLGKSTTIKVNVRVIAATNRDLEKEIKLGRFREDLFYRLNVFPIRVPPLRERREDIPLLVKHFAKKYSAKIGRKIESVSTTVLETLQQYDWPGNVRELENVIERAVILCPDEKLTLVEWLPKTETPSVVFDDLCTLEEAERKHILAALQKSGGRVSGERGAAKILGMNPKTLESRMKKLNLQRN